MTTTTTFKAEPILRTIRTPQEQREAPGYMEKLATKFRELEAEKKALEAKQDALKQEMIAELNGADKMAAGMFTVRYQLIKSNVFNTSAFKNNCPDTYRQYLTEKSAYRFTVA